MNIYIVKLKGKIFNKHMIVEANNFNYNTFANTIIFVDKDGRNVAFFNKNEVEYVRMMIQEEKADTVKPDK